MVFSTRDARKSSMSLNLQDWCKEPDDGEKRTIIIRLFQSIDETKIVDQLEEIDSNELEFYNGVLVGQLSREAVVAIDELPGIISIQLPERLLPSKTILRTSKSPKKD